MASLPALGICYFPPNTLKGRSYSYLVKAVPWIPPHLYCLPLWKKASIYDVVGLPTQDSETASQYKGLPCKWASLSGQMLLTASTHSTGLSTQLPPTLPVGTFSVTALNWCPGATMQPSDRVEPPAWLCCFTESLPPRGSQDPSSVPTIAGPAPHLTCSSCLPNPSR